jgi:SAM-dependent methyltransferase
VLGAYPERYRSLARLFWTPERVAREAAAFLAGAPRAGRRGARVLDVGSGGGAFCLAAALASGRRVRTGRVRQPSRESAAIEPLPLFVGVEHSRELHGVAQAAARRLRVSSSRARFVHGRAFALGWSRFDAFYFHNPFFDVRGTARAYRAAVAEARRRLARAPAGTRVATYFGLGGPLPASYRLVRRLRSGGDWLELWEKGQGAAVGAKAPRGAKYNARARDRASASFRGRRRAASSGSPGARPSPRRAGARAKKAARARSRRRR